MNLGRSCPLAASLLASALLHGASAEAQAGDGMEVERLEDVSAQGIASTESPLSPIEADIGESLHVADSGVRDRHAQPSSETSGLGFAPIGAVTYSSETSAMFGAAVVLFYKPPAVEQRRTSQVTLAVAYSVRRQLLATAQTELFLFQDRFFIRAETNFLVYPDSFFGIGNDTRLGDEERFTPRTYEVRALPLYELLENLFVGAAFRLEGVEVANIKPGGLLDTLDTPGAGGGFDFSFGIAASYDTRDSTLYPRRGSLLQYWTLLSDPAFGSDFRMSRTLLDLRRYFPLGPRDHVLALQGVGRFTSGDVPFFALGRLGGEKLLRGHFNGRYRDKQLLAAQTEYRFPLWWRLGMAVFGGIGDVAEDIDEFRLNEIKYGVGGGLRLNIARKERIQFRGDFGWGGDEYGFYVNLGEAF